MASLGLGRGRVQLELVAQLARLLHAQHFSHVVAVAVVQEARDVAFRARGADDRANRALLLLVVQDLQLAGEDGLRHDGELAGVVVLDEDKITGVRVQAQQLVAGIARDAGKLELARGRRDRAADQVDRHEDALGVQQAEQRLALFRALVQQDQDVGVADLEDGRVDELVVDLGQARDPGHFLHVGADEVLAGEAVAVDILHDLLDRRLVAFDEVEVLARRHDVRGLGLFAVGARDELRGHDARLVVGQLVFLGFRGVDQLDFKLADFVADRALQHDGAGVLGLGFDDAVAADVGKAHRGDELDHNRTIAVHDAS